VKLSEKLAALEEQERKAAGATNKVRTRTDAKGTRRKSTSTTGWASNKRKVRELVLAEVAPKMSGLTDAELMKEVRTALDRIVQREDVRVSPIERRKFVDEVFRDTLGYGPLDPLLADDSVTEVMCNNFDDIWVERDGKVEHTGTAFTDEAQYRAVI